MNQKTIYFGLFGLTIVLFVLAMITVTPNGGASIENLLGYKSVCSFTPIGTLILLWFAGVFCTIRARVKNPSKIKTIPIPIIIVSVIFAGLIIYYLIQLFAVV